MFLFLFLNWVLSGVGIENRRYWLAERTQEDRVERTVMLITSIALSDVTFVTVLYIYPYLPI